MTPWFPTAVLEVKLEFCPKARLGPPDIKNLSFPGIELQVILCHAGLDVS